MKHLNYFKRFTVIGVKWLEIVLLQSEHLHLGLSVLSKFHKVLSTRGVPGAIAFCKESRSSVYSWLSGLRNLDPTERTSTASVLPKYLRFLAYQERVEYPLIRLLLSVLYWSRALVLPPKISTASITKGPTFSGDPKDVLEYVPDFWRDLGLLHKHGVPRRVLWKGYHLTTHSGPNGHGLWSAIADLQALPDSLKESIKVVAGDKLATRMDILEGYLPFLDLFFKVTGRRFRKVSAIQDSEGKTREVAILDYWSQTALRGLHQYLFDRLRSIPQDCTFHQGSFKDKLPQADGKVMFYSVDLTTATDRFPIDLIEGVLKGRFPKYYVKAWRDIMVGYPFDCPQLGKESKILYAVGNPMGAYSSWNSFALAHHYVVYRCCRRLGKEWRKCPYVLLGDDIVIADRAVAKLYMKTMSSIGVEFSLQKSHISPYLYEFAKRITHMGIEVTPFPLGALWSVRTSPAMMLSVLNNEAFRGWEFPKGIPDACSEFLRMLGRNRTYCARMSKLLLGTFQLMEAIRGRIDATQALKPVLEKYWPELVETPPPIFGPRSKQKWQDHAVRTAICNSFESSAFTLENQQNLGRIAGNLMDYILSNEHASKDSMDLEEAIPLIPVHNRVLDSYQQIMECQDNQWVNSFKSERWKTILRSMTIPVSDKVYVVRNQDLLVHSTFKLFKILSAILDLYNRDFNGVVRIPRKKEKSIPVKSLIGPKGPIRFKLYTSLDDTPVQATGGLSLWDKMKAFWARIGVKGWDRRSR